MVFVNYFAAAGIIIGPIASYLSGERNGVVGAPKLPQSF